MQKGWVGKVAIIVKQKRLHGEPKGNNKTYIIFSCMSVRMLGKKFTSIIHSPLKNQGVDLKVKGKGKLYKPKYKYIHVHAWLQCMKHVYWCKADQVQPRVQITIVIGLEEVEHYASIKYQSALKIARDCMHDYFVNRMTQGPAITNKMTVSKTNFEVGRSVRTFV